MRETECLSDGFRQRMERYGSSMTETEVPTWYYGSYNGGGYSAGRIVNPESRLKVLLTTVNSQKPLKN